MKFLIWLLVSPAAWAFPDMVRHGYVHCTSCHTSLVGGSVLNDYGRSLSREVLSQPKLAGRESAEGDEAFAYGLISRPDWLLLGADVRVLQSFVESKVASRGRFFIMQVDLDASAQVSERWRFFGSIGRIEPTGGDATARDFVAVPRAGAEYLFTPADAKDRVALRAGRFVPAYGIAFAEHTFVTRQGLGFGPALERLAAELAWNNDSTSVVVTGIQARYSGNETLPEQGWTAQVATAIGEKSKIGANYWSTHREGAGRRQMYGVFSHIGFNKDWYALLDVNILEEAKTGLVELFKIGYEITPGLQLMAIQEHANYDRSRTDPKFEAYSAGVQWFPRPHWDLFALYRRERNTALPAPQTNAFDDRVWLIGHFYL